MGTPRVRVRSKGSVPAIPANDYLKPIRSKRKIKAKIFSDYNTQNIVKRHQNLHNKCYQLPSSKTDTYRNSYFPKTISEWNELPDYIVNAESANIFKDRLLNYKSE